MKKPVKLAERRRDKKFGARGRGSGLSLQELMQSMFNSCLIVLVLNEFYLVRGMRSTTYSVMGMNMTGRWLETMRLNAKKISSSRR